MKKWLIASTCVVALWAGHAQAQITPGVPTIDMTVFLQEAKTTLQEAKNYLLQAQQYATQVQQYATEAQQLAALVHDPNLPGVMALAGQAGLTTDLPINPMAVQSLTSGYGSLASLGGILGKLSQLNGLVNTSFANNHVYSPTDGSWNSQQLIANGNSIAGTQGAALSAYQDLQNHLPIIQALRDRLATARTPKDVQDAQAQLATEQLWTNNLQTKLQAINVQYQAQRDSRVQRDNESLDAGIDGFLADANAAGRGLTQ